LESIIGKVKTQRYGSKILEEVEKYANSDPQDINLPNQNEGTENKASKRQKTKRATVIIESSSDDEAG
ncbi:hypothetical protein CRG98_043780, partial [Punica granatum]